VVRSANPTPGGRRDALRFVLREAFPVGALAVALSACVDRYFYGRWELVPWNFFKFNVLAGGSAAYGSHPWWGGTS
jgi:phosphatidylinositol glycan class B